MIELATHIEYMLLSRDKVSVPQLGTFIVRDMSSKRVDEEGIFLPPYRTVSFQWNEEEAGEDFVHSLSRLHNLTHNEARILCLEYVDELRQVLAEDGTVSVGSMGYMLRDAQSREVSFMPLQSGIASPAYYGLDAIPFAKLSNDVRQHRDKKIASRKTKLITIVTDQETATIRINRRFLNYATAVAASVVLFFAFASPIENTISEIGQRASIIFAPKITSSQPKEIQAEAVAEPKQTEESSTALNTASAPIDDKASQNVQCSVERPYAIVLASAISKANAISFADNLQAQGHNAQACEFGGMVRVIIPGFETQDEAYAEIRRLKADSKEFAHAWPCLVKDEVKPISSKS